VIKRLLLVAAAVSGLVACGSSSAPSGGSTSGTATSGTAASSSLSTLATALITSPGAAFPAYLAGKDLKFFQDKLGKPDLKSVLVVHYHRFDNDYPTWNAFTFIQGVEGFATDFTEDDAFGKVAIVGSANTGPQRGFIIRKGEWIAKDTPDDRFVEMPASGLAEVWVVSGLKAFYTDPSGIDLSSSAQIAFMDSANQIKLSYNVPPTDLTASKLSVSVAGVAQTISALSQSGKLVTLTLASPLRPEDASKPVILTGQGVRSPLTVYLRGVLADDAYTTSERDLGASYTPAQTTFKVWSPVSNAVSVLLYNTPADTVPVQTLALTRTDKGVWSGAAGGNLAGKFYLLQVENYGVVKTTGDPYGKGASNYFETQPLNSKMSAVVDLASTNPAGWKRNEWDDNGADQYGAATTNAERGGRRPVLRCQTDANVYEVHIRDFTVSSSSGVDAGKRGKYLGMVQNGTKVPGTNLATGLDHLKALGVNTVQLMPAFDYGNQTEGAYNWGYDPVFYNAPEAQYSSQPNDPAATVREFKMMVKGLQDNGLNVIMDVVYNHTKYFGERSPFDMLVPFYYYRTDDDGNHINDSGVGNTFAAERPMARAFIIDSLRYWAREYHIQGFRFDLLGTMKPADVKAVMSELRLGNPNLVLYGEPWTGGGPVYFDKGAQKGLNVGVFNDNFRNGIIGGVFEIGTQGFIQGAFNLAPAVQKGLNGSIGDFTQEPGESVNYATSHDNFVLWDRLSLGASASKDEATRKGMQKLAAALVQTAQGLPFMVGGEELARTKKGDGNSYNSPDEINQFDWTRLAQFADVNAYYSNIIKLRRAHPAFRYSKRADIEASYTPLSLNGAQGLIGFVLDGKRAGDDWNKTLVIFNAAETDQVLTLPAGTWSVMVKGDTFGRVPLETVSGSYTVPRLSTLIARDGRRRE
jgi:pullulanase